jgi:hypothetical protein
LESSLLVHLLALKRFFILTARCHRRIFNRHHAVRLKLFLLLANEVVHQLPFHLFVFDTDHDIISDLIVVLTDHNGPVHAAVELFVCAFPNISDFLLNGLLKFPLFAFS